MSEKTFPLLLFLRAVVIRRYELPSEPASKSGMNDAWKFLQLQRPVDLAMSKNQMAVAIMDNFEWELGYSKRFGVAYVDYDSMSRIPKDSYHWFRQLVSANGTSLPDHTAPLR